MNGANKLEQSTICVLLSPSYEKQVKKIFALAGLKNCAPYFGKRYGDLSIIDFRSIYFHEDLIAELECWSTTKPFKAFNMVTAFCRNATWVITHLPDKLEEQSVDAVRVRCFPTAVHGINAWTFVMPKRWGRSTGVYFGPSFSLTEFAQIEHVDRFVYECYEKTVNNNKPSQ
jgi:hypothetical protein